MFLSFGENNGELFWREHFYNGRLGDIAFNVHAGFHLYLEILRQFFAGRNDVFFFVRKIRIEQFVGDAAIVGKDDETV